MVDRVDMSLDDIIKKDKIKTGRPLRNGGNKFTARAKPAAGRQTKRTAVKKIAATRKSVKTKAPAPARRSNASTSGANRARPAPKMAGIPAADVRSSVLEVSNLHYEVLDADLKELFREFGPVKKVVVHYDASGRSLGKAEVFFPTVVSATNALRKYNGVSLDGRPMTIVTKVSQAARASIVSRLGKPNNIKPIGRNGNRQANNTKPRNSNTSGGKPGPSKRGQAANRGGRGSTGGGRGGQRNQSKSPKKAVTQEDLDRDLDAFVGAN